MFTWHRGDFHPGASSLRFPLIALHFFTWYHFKMSCWRGVSSPRLLYRGENFTLVWNLGTVSCKRKTTTRFGGKSVCRWTRTGSACVMFAILNHTYNLLTWSVHSNNEIWNDPVIMQTGYKIKKSSGMILAPVRIFSCKHPPHKHSGNQDQL